MKNDLSKELDFYVKNQEQFVSNYKGKFISIQDEKVLGVFDNMIEAIKYCVNVLKLEFGTFLVHECMPGKENYTLFLHSTY